MIILMISLKTIVVFGNGNTTITGPTLPTSTTTTTATTESTDPTPPGNTTTITTYHNGPGM